MFAFQESASWPKTQQILFGILTFEAVQKLSKNSAKRFW